MICKKVYHSFFVFLIFAIAKERVSSMQPIQSCQDVIYRQITATPYTPLTPPFYSNNDQLKVVVQMSLVDLIELVERDETITTSWVTKTSWTDPRLRWTPSTCNFVSLPGTSIYIPDFRIFNDESKMSTTKLFDTSYRVYIHYNGLVEWYTAGIVTTSCQLDVTYFPFDYQVCYIHVECSSLATKNMLLIADNSSMSLGTLEGNDQWNIVATQVVSDVRMGLSNLKFYIYLKRKPFYFVLNIVAPTILLSFMSLSVFWLPARADEKMGLSVTILLAFTVFMLTISTVLPTSSDSTSLLGLYTLNAMILGALAVVASIFTENICHLQKNQKPSRSLRRLCNNLCRLMLMKNIYYHREDIFASRISIQPLAVEKMAVTIFEKQLKEELEEGTDYSEEYAFYSTVIDRSLFWVFLIVNISVAIFLLAIYPQASTITLPNT